ncbi:proteasome assembly chaperone family protein [Desulfurococcus mucosus]|uniref:proteasome assembly chaperone family protein n=1 Tax=Desulfurococcus mucosus TaxID=2275 RepID=UPI00200E1B8F|nr:PAC2 family protein [Desulfurococcus mucosus]
MKRVWNTVFLHPGRAPVSKHARCSPMDKPVRTLRFDTISIYEYSEALRQDGPPRFLILSFPDTGLVSSIAGRHLVVSEGFSIVGEIDAPSLSHISVVHNGRAVSPIQIYYSEASRILMVLSEVPLPLGIMHPLIDSILTYLHGLGMENVVTVSGLAVPNRFELEKPNVFLLSTGEWRGLKELGFEELKEGFITGPYAALMKEARRRGVNALVIFVESFYDIPDPESAAVGLQALSKVTGLEVDVSRLISEAELLKLKMRDLMRQTREAMSSLEKDLEKKMPLMYT